MSLNRLPSPEALPALRERRHSTAAGSESPRPASPSQQQQLQQPPQQRASDPAGAATAFASHRCYAVWLASSCQPLSIIMMIPHAFHHASCTAREAVHQLSKQDL